MPDDIGFNPHTSPIYTGTNPFADDWHPQESTPHYGNQSHQGPEGLEGRPPSMGGMPPRQHFGMPPGGGGGGGGGGGPPLPPVDDATMHAIMMQRQQTANNSALAEATAEAQGTQGLNEFLKSMAEMQAKSTKSSGEKLAGLA